MKMEALFLFLILLCGLILASFLGTNEAYTNRKNNYHNSNNTTDTSYNNVSYSDISYNTDLPYFSSLSTNYDNYNHYTGSNSTLTLQNGLVFTDAIGDTLTVSTTKSGLQTLELSQPENSSTMVLNQSSTNPNLFNAPFGNVNATIVTDSNNQTAVQINLPNGETIVFTQPTSTNSTQYYGSTGKSIPSSSYSLAYQDTPTTQTSSTQYYGPYGGSTYNEKPPPPPPQTSSTQYYGLYGNTVTAGSVTGPAGNTAYYAQGPYGNTATAGSATGPGGNTAYYAQGPYGNTATAVTGTTTQTSANQYYGPYGGTAGSVTGPAGNTAYYAQGPYGNTATAVTGTTYNSDYYSSLPAGISKSEIPPGQEDAYILKSEIVPPVCPACSMTPSSMNCPRQEPCPPCPACARCPEPSFECKKVPNYNAMDADSLPMPVLADFSQFGM